MFGSQSAIVLTVVVVLVALIAGAWSYRALSRWLRRCAMQRRFKRGHMGEQKARAYLKRNGYRILGEEVTIEPRMWIDGVEARYKVRADYLAEKKGIRSIFEVKTGNAASVNDRATRRQLREYAAVYDVDEVCLYDGNTDSHVTVRFVEPPAGRGRRNFWALWLNGLIIGVVLGLLLSQFLPNRSLRQELKTIQGAILPNFCVEAFNFGFLKKNQLFVEKLLFHTVYTDKKGGRHEQ